MTFLACHGIFAVILASLSFYGAGDGIRTRDSLLGSQANTFKLLNKLTVTELAQLSKLSKSYISQVKHGKCPPSKRLLDAITDTLQPEKDYFSLFLKSRQSMGVSPRTLEFYDERLSKFIAAVTYAKATRADVRKYLNSIPPNQYGLATRHASFRAIRTFYRWLEAEYGLKNLVSGMHAPILSKPILPSLSANDVRYLIEKTENTRDKAIIALSTESGLRLSELVNVKPCDIDWESKTIKTLGKGRKEAYAPFGDLSEAYLKEWLAQYVPNGNIWGINKNGIQTMLARLEKRTGLHCNPHTFRRTFACLLRKQGLDVLTIKDLGRWESLEMVQRYTRSVTFQDSLKFYKAPLG
ncbi:tyrosine-type recombinase/integrase [Chloroflexota bacterium]